MLEQLGTLCVQALDWILGWILYLPRDLSLLAVALLTSVSLTFARKWTTDQAWLRLAAADTARLAVLRREAKARGDREAARRSRDVGTRIKLMSLRYEWRPLLWAMLPVALLATWAFARLAYLPPVVGATIEVRAHLPASAANKQIHLAPEPGVEVQDGWMRTVVADQAQPPTGLWDRADAWFTGLASKPPRPKAVASWRVVCLDDQPHTLKIRCDGRTYAFPLVAGRNWYEAPETAYDDGSVQTVTTGLTERRLFGSVGGISIIFFAPWLVAYLLLAIPLVFVLKRVFKIH